MAMSWPSRAKFRRPGSAGSPTARQVPRLIHTAMPLRRARLSAQPMWSPCSWVTKIASMSSGSRPLRVSRASNSRNVKPQSTSTRVVVMPSLPSTSVALPPLPLPRLQKRITSLQILDEQRDDLLAGLAVLRRARRIEHRHRAAVAIALDGDAVLGRAAGLVLLAEAEE